MRVLVPLGLALFAASLYAGSLSAPFVFDDRKSILDNPTIRACELPACLSARPGTPTAGRPLVNLSFALNHALSGFDPFGYHALNLAIHIACSWLVFLCLARLFAAERMPDALRQRASALAAVTALLFAVHPIAAEVVLYTSQRSEGLVSLFFLLACYAFLRHAGGRGELAMVLLAALASVCGALSKASIAALAPLLLLCDRAFYAGSIAQALRRRAGMFAALAVGYVPLAVLEAGRPRGDTVSFWDPGYLVAQGRYVSGYLLSVFWPRLAFDYGPYRPALAEGAWPFAIAIGCIVLASAVLVVTHPRAVFVPAWVFALLAPTSSLVVIHTEVAADRRMYLPMLALLAAAVAGAGAALAALGARRAWPSRRHHGVAWASIAVAGGALSVQTAARTDAFASETAFWEHALAEQPRNARAAYNLGEALHRAGDLDGALRAYEAALYLDPRYADAHLNLGALLMQRGRSQDGLFHVRRAIEIGGTALTHYNYGLAMRELGRPDLARAGFERAVQLEPSYAEAHVNLGILLMSSGQVDRGLRHLARGTALRPEPHALLNYAAALGQAGRLLEAKAQLARALELDPKLETARARLAAIEGQLAPTPAR